jgi:hypothetical protein
MYQSSLEKINIGTDDKQKKKKQEKNPEETKKRATSIPVRPVRQYLFDF